jgi:hypothetical protein
MPGTWLKEESGSKVAEWESWACAWQTDDCAQGGTECDEVGCYGLGKLTGIQG